MFKGKTFYHQHVRKALMAFGAIINNIRVNRRDPDNNLVQTLDVPVTYGPKQKFITRIIEAPDLEQGRATFQVTIPRIGYEITNINYDASRKLQTMNAVRAIGQNNAVRFAYMSVPYNIQVKATIFVRNQEDGYHILEQILPYFGPDFNVTINELPALGVKRDLQITLDAVELNDNYEGDLEDERLITWDLTFTIRMNLFGYVNDASLIKRTIQNIYATDDATEDSPVGLRITAEVDPADQDPSSNFTFTTEREDLPTEET